MIDDTAAICPPQAGNRTADAVRTSYSYDAANRIQADSAFTYTSDANGNITSRKDRLTGQTTSYAYDSSGQMIEVDGPGGVIATYKYDPAGNRVERTTGGTTLRYVYDKGRPLAILDANNNLVMLLTEGPGIDAPLSMRKGSQDYFFHEDALGNVTALTDNAAGLVESYEYQAFGRAVVKDSQSNLFSQSTVGNSYLYSARELDPETGFIFMRARTYDPDTGRFWQEDPLPSVSQYTFALNSPILYSDPTGLSALDDTANAASGCGAGMTAGLSLGLSNGIGPAGGTDPCSRAYKAAYGACKLWGFVTANLLLGKVVEAGIAKVTGAFGRAGAADLEAGASAETGAPSVGGGPPRGGPTDPSQIKLVIGRTTDLKAPGTLGPGEYRLEWPDAGSPKANWKINDGLLRQEMQRGVPIRDASPGDTEGPFLNAERNRLLERGWKYNDETGEWVPPRR